MLELEPDNIAVLNNLAAVVQHRGNRAEALKIFNRAFAIAPDNLSLRYNRAICHLTEGNLRRRLG